MNIKFVQTDNEELISKTVEQLNGETFYVTQIGIVRHRSQLKKVIDEMALELQRDEQTYNTVSEPYRRALSLMNACDESAMLRQFDKAASFASEAAKLFPSMVEALRGIADSYFSLGKFSDAIAAYNRLIQVYPNLPDVHYQLGRSLFETGRLDEAIQQFATEMQISGEAADIYLQIGSIHFSCAMDVFNKLYDSGERRPSFLLSKCGDRLEKARASFETGIRVDPKSDELRQLLQQVTKVLNSLR
jgi:tetratricopeptide (TPR) repeat protein